MGAVVGWLAKTFVGKLITSYAINAVTNKLFGAKQRSSSPTYAFGALQTQANNSLVMPMVYGKVKMAGNDIWASPEGTTQSRLIGFGFGKISGFEEIKLNDIDINTLGNVNYTAYLGDGYQFVDSRVTGSTQEDKAKLVGGLKYDAYLAITATANDKLSGNYNVTTVVKGRIVKNYTTPTVYTEAWSDNPAWCILDFLMHYNGCAIKIEDIDIQSFITAAKYCDEMVNGQKRFTLNLALDEKKSKQDWLDEMLIVCRGFKTYQNGKHGIVIDKPEVTSQIFDIQLDEDLQIEWAENNNLYEQVQITYLDPEYKWAKVGAVAKVLPFQNRSPIAKIVEVFGVTNFQQASQLAWFYINQAQTCRATYVYKTNQSAINRSVCDVVEINDPITGVKNKKCRIMSISNSEDGTIVLTMREYNENLYTDTMGSVKPIVYRTSLPNPAIAPPDVSNIIIDEPIYYRNKDGTIISVLTGSCTLPNYGLFNNAIVEYTIDNEETWNYNGLLGDSGNFTINNVITSKYYKVRIKVQNKAGIFSNGVISNSVLITGIDKPPSDVANITATIDPTNSTKIIINWSDIDDIDKKGFYLWENDTLIEKNIISTQYIYTAKESKAYIFMVKAVDNFDNLSVNYTITPITVKIEPANVMNFKVEQIDTNKSKVKSTWNANTETDFGFYKLKIGQDWETGKVVEEQIKGTSYEYTLPNEGVFYFMLKAYNFAGNCSVGPATCNGTFIIKPNAPANGTIKQDATDKSILIINWDAVKDKDIYKYIIYNSAGQEIDRISDTTYRYKINKSGSYQFSIKVLNVAGYYSNALNLNIAAKIEPLNVIGFRAIQSIFDHSKVTLLWDINNEASYFIIKKGESWDNSVVVNPRVYGTSFDVKILEEIEHIYWIKAVSIAGNESQYPSKVDEIYNLNPSVPTNLIVEQDVNDRSTLNISWNGIPELDILEYQLKWGNTWETATTIVKTKETRATFKPPITGDYKIMIKARNNSDFYSDEVTTHFYATLEPSNVENFQALQNGEDVELLWNISPDADAISYRIIEGASYENGRLIAEGLTLTNFEVPVDTERLYYFHIKTLNRSGKYSELPATAIVKVENLPPKNVILKYDEITLKNGTSTNVEFGKSLINASNFGGRASDYPNVKASEVGGQTVLKLKATNSLYPLNGEYICARKDMGQVITANISTLFYATNAFALGGNARLQFRTSRDSTNWTTWVDFKPALCTFRYVDFKVVFVTVNNKITPEVNTLQINIDVPDTQKTGTATVPVGGLTISYGNTFWTEPAVICHAVGVGLHTEIQSKNNSSFVVKVLSNSNVDVGGKISWQAIGY